VKTPKKLGTGPENWVEENTRWLAKQADMTAFTAGDKVGYLIIGTKDNVAGVPSR